VFVCLWPLLRGFVGRYLPPEDAEDAAQEALVKVFARAALFDPTRDALSWALGIAAYEIKTARRRRQRRREEGEPPVALPDGAAGPEALAIACQRGDAIEAVLASLDPADAATLRAYASGAPPPVSGATFRKRVQRALARLRVAWRISHGRS
jgi:RNA polymerase sigma-70 factor, ECF subfamily